MLGVIAPCVCGKVLPWEARFTLSDFETGILQLQMDSCLQGVGVGAPRRPLAPGVAAAEESGHEAPLEQGATSERRRK